MTDPLYIQAGELRHQIQIQAPSSSRDSAGQQISTWNVVLNTRAKIEGSNSRTYKESFANNAFASQSTDILTIRWPGGAVTIEPDMRVIFGDNTYLIQAVDNVQHRNRKVVLACIMIDEDSN
jgi:SPP1 family predicted phage head-tail adaptor